MIASFIFIIGAAIQTAAKNYAMMIAGRFVAGLGVGSLSMVVPLYQVRRLNMLYNTILNLFFLLV
jgi:predicted MFS family arabinose efflux permease